MKLYVLCVLIGFSSLANTRRLSASELLEAPGPSGALVGTLERAAKPSAPIVLIIPGSGPVNRDGDSPAGLKASTYKLLANGLAQHGITTLRIDKRGMFGSIAAVPDPNNVTIADYADDVGKWIKVLLARTGASCVWVLGHSEGGLVALVAAQREPGICGLVLVATPGRSLGEVIRRQLRANPANASILPEALSALESLEAGRRVDVAQLNPVLLPLFRPAVQEFLMSELALDPTKLIAGLRMPVLILQGERDLQVAPDDAHRLASADREAKLDLAPDVNHVLKSVTSPDRATNLATYGDPTLPLAPGLTGRIACFVSSRTSLR